MFMYKLLLSISMMFLIISFMMMNLQEMYIWKYELFSMNSCSLNFSVLLDSLSVSFTFVILTISGSVLMYSYFYMSSEKNYRRFLKLVLMFILSMIVLVFSSDMLVMMIGWDGLGFTSFLLVNFYQNSKCNAASMLTFLMNRLGDSFLFFSICLCLNLGSFSYFNVNDKLLLCSSFFFMLGILIASMIKGAQMPFSIWLPAAMAAPTPVSALVHSSTLVTAGVYMLIRFNDLLMIHNSLSNWLLFISVMTTFMSGLAANFEYDLKKIIALSTLSQIGIMLTSISMGLKYSGMFHLYTHALFKALLFLCAGIMIIACYGDQDIRCMGGLKNEMPIMIYAFNLGNLALCGIPFTGGFYSKDYILEMMQIHPIISSMLLIISLISLGLTISYSLRLSYYTMFKMNTICKIKVNFSYYFAYVPIIILSISAILIGGMLSFFYMPFFGVIIVPIFSKQMIFLFLFMGFFIGLLVSLKSWSSSFISSLLFLNNILTQSVSELTYNSSFMMTKNLEHGWMEEKVGKNILSLMKVVSKKNYMIQLSWLNLSIFSVFWSYFWMLTVML